MSECKHSFTSGFGAQNAAAFSLIIDKNESSDHSRPLLFNFRGDVPEWLTGRFAKPYFVSSILTVTSKFQSLVRQSRIKIRKNQKTKKTTTSPEEVR